VLLGRSNEKLLRAGHDRLPTYGAGKAKDERYWRSVLRQLYAANVITIDMANYGAARLGERGRRVLRQGEKVMLRVEAPRARKSAAERRIKPAAATMPEAADDALLARLKKLRAELARARAVPAYIVFSDKTLIDMATRRPRDRAAFGEVYGVGERKLQEFADVFLQEIARHDGAGV
jgi:ATP-dependent DNA helicase RecQ